MHRPARFAATQNVACGLGEVRDHDHHDPADQRERDGAHVADGVLQVAEAERADRRGDVHHQDQHDGLLRRELHRLLGVDRGERDDRGDARLVEQDAEQEAAQVAVLLRVRAGSAARRANGFSMLRLRHRAFPQEEEGGRRGEGEERRGDQHRDRHRLAGRLALRGQDVGEADAERHQAAEVAEAQPQPETRPIALRVGELRQERGDQVLARAEEVVRRGRSAASASATAPGPA